MANYGDLSNDDAWEALLQDVVLNFERKLGVWNTTVTVDELRAKAQQRTSAELLRLIYEKEAKADGASHIFVKENGTYLFAAFLLAHFERCRFVFMVRDPRDVASSWVTTQRIPGSVEKAVDVWGKDQTAAWALYPQLRGSGRILFLRYEDLLTDTETWLESILEFLELSYDMHMLDFHKHPRTTKNADRIEAWANLRRPVIKRNAGKYRTTLSLPDLRYIELRCYDLMGAFGYLPEQVTERPDPHKAATELETLRGSIDPDSYAIISSEEQKIRERRLVAINRVLQRRF